MKKYIFLIAIQVFLYQSYKSTAQPYEYEVESYELSSGDYTGNTYNIVARDYITCSPRFSFTATGGNTFTASIDEFLTFNADYLGSKIDPDNRVIKNDDYVVGTTAGTAGASNGAAVYNIPIFIAPGTAGMQPGISVNYNSHGGNGIMGMGWNISGLSAITRVPMNVIHDGEDKSR